jgi:hypothetical protein
MPPSSSGSSKLGPAATFPSSRPASFINESLPSDRQQSLNADRIALARRFDRNSGSGSIAIAADYLETVIVRK